MIKHAQQRCVVEYASVLRSMLICQAMSDIFSVNEDIRKCAMQCLIRTKSENIRIILRSFIIAKQPVKALNYEISRIEAGGMQVVEFLDVALDIDS